MPDKFKNKYRIESTRLQNWDYGWQAEYFITICTKNRECLFGDVVDGIMKLSNLGIVANLCWYEIKNHAKNVELGEFVVMPNHVHGILILNGDDMGDTINNMDNATTTTTVDKSTNVTNATNVETTHALSLPQPPPPIDNILLPENPVETTHALSLQQPPEPKTIGQQRFQNQGKNTVSSIVGSYKSAVTKHAHRLGFDFAWQILFHDHIIRDEKSFNTISEYIVNNPMNWSADKFYK